MSSNDLSKDKILKCAIEILDTEGIRALTITKVVNICKISKSTFYKYFSSKEDLILEIKELSDKNEEDFYSVREEIIQKAIEEFSNNMFDKIDIDTIANAVGLKRSSIYRYFSSKEELLEASLKNEIINRKKLDDYFINNPYEPESFINKLFEYCMMFYNKKYNSLMFSNALYYSKVNDNIKKILDDLWQQTINMIEHIFERGKHEGVFRQDINSTELAQMTFSYIGGLAIFSCDDYDKLSKQFITLLFNDIK